jgi:hypothetical protein
MAQKMVDLLSRPGVIDISFSGDKRDILKKKKTDIEECLRGTLLLHILCSGRACHRCYPQRLKYKKHSHIFIKTEQVIDLRHIRKLLRGIGLFGCGKCKTDRRSTCSGLLDIIR